MTSSPPLLIAQDESVRAVVLRGAGRAFMAGGDLHSLRADPEGGAAAMLVPLNAAAESLAHLNAPVIAQVHGAGAGAGMSLMMLADFVLVAEGTRLNLAYMKLGTCSDAGASWALPRLVGLRAALEIALLCDDLSLQDALRLGLINRVLPKGEMEEAVLQLAQRLGKGPTLAMGHMRRLMRSSFERTLSAQLVAEADAFGVCTRTEDMRRGIAAFFERREPQFLGC